MCVYLILAPMIVQAGLAASPGEMPCPWDLSALSAPPATYEAPVYGVDETAGLGSNPELRFTGEGVQPLFYEGLPWQGRPTRVFAWYGAPKHAEGEKVPGMVLVHGGGGTAFDAWVRKWNERGYAAIAMDLTGSRPGGKPGERPRHEWGGPPHAGFEQDIDLPVADQWVYHAIADIVLADSLLRSFPEVDADRIGLTGISWGGFLTCIASAVDTRFRFAIPVYGCGFHNEGPALQSQWQLMGEERAAKWFDLWDPSRYLHHTTMPMLWITGSNDFFAPLSIHSKSMALPKGPCTLCVPVGMSHSHVAGWAPEEIYVYADSILKGGTPLARIGGGGRGGYAVWAEIGPDVPAKRVELVTTADVTDWTACKWDVTPVEIDAERAMASAFLPADCRAYFFNLTDERGLLVSTKVDVLPERGASERIKAFCVDFNWGPEGFAPPGMYANASPEKHLAWYRQLGVNTIQTFCVSCPGCAWYPSEVAPVQPGKGGEFLPEIVKLGHEAGLKVMGYFCIGANAYWSETHPDLTHPFPNAIAIPFTTAYLEYLSRVIAEAVAKTGIDGFMIDWMYNASHHYPDKKYAWLDCEKQMYLELFDGEPFPGDAAMDAARVLEFNRRATARCWERIRDAAKSAKPDCIIWLSAYDVGHPMIAGSKMLKEVDWLMNEHPDPAKLDAVRGSVGPQTRLIQCVCGWGEQHQADAILANPKYADIGLYGFARPDVDTTLPPEDGAGNARNIAAMRRAFTAP